MSTTTTTTPAIAKTMTITSTATPTLNGTYNIAGAMETAGLLAEVNAIALDDAFADGTQTVNWPDINRTAHSFTVAQFKTFATAVALYKAQWTQYAYGLITTAPSNAATIP